MMSRKPELLAPAGNWESLVAAVGNGADAVYLGGRAFNARQSAGNFTGEELVRAVEFAHVRGVKVYVTVNTLLDERELDEAAGFLHFLQQIGADAAIVQDLGLAWLARQVVPELPLHASTQMTVHNLPAALVLKEAGIERIIAARELSLAALKEMVQRGGIKVEVFIHGALCVCYSGQCLMSSLIGGRSGNRGCCAQPCRLNYELVDRRGGRSLVNPEKTGKYLLSPKDLNLSAHLPDLIAAGIVSFKIEGRMKRPEYVATVVRVYRELLNRAAAGEEFLVRPEEARDLAQIFNRDFTTGYFYGRPGRGLMSYKRPNHRGVRLGRVKNFDRRNRLAEILLEEPLRLGDGIEAWVTEGGRAAGKVRRILLNGRPVERAPAASVVRVEITGRIAPGDRVFKVYDADLMERARAGFTSPREQRKIPVKCKVTARPGTPLRITVQDPDGLTGVAETAAPARTALKSPLTPDYLKKQLSRLGNTPYTLAGVECALAGEIMVPVSQINAARRTALEILSQRRAAALKPPPVPLNVFKRRLERVFTPSSRENAGPRFSGRPGLAVAVNGPASLEAAVRAGCSEVYFGGEYYRSQKPVTLKDIHAAAETCARGGVRFILSAPRIQQDGELDDYCRLLEKTAALPVDGLLAGNLGLIKKAREITGKPVYADFSLNTFNHRTAHFLKNVGVSRVTLSPELTAHQIEKLIPLLPVPAEIIIHGAMPLMVAEHCIPGALLGGGRPFDGCRGPCRDRRYGLKDRKGVIFPLEMDQACRMHIFNSRDLCMLDRVGDLAAAGPAVLRVEARQEGADYVRDVVRAYRRVMAVLPEALTADELAGWKQSLVRYSPAGFTRGHYYRGV